jgi:hypothetical protein
VASNGRNGSTPFRGTDINHLKRSQFVAFLNLQTLQSYYIGEGSFYMGPERWDRNWDDEVIG